MKSAGAALAGALVVVLGLADMTGCACEDSLRPPRAVGDGVAPWAEAPNPIIVCDGARVLVAPGDPSSPRRIAGTCGSATTTGATCSTDADCGLRERCLCEACVAPLCTPNEASLCAPDLSCVQTSFTNPNVRRCLTECEPDDPDGRCAPSERCEDQVDGSYVCVGTCDGDADCTGGERCNAGLCRLSGLCDSVAPDCSAGQTCRLLGELALLRGPTARVVDGGPATGGSIELYFAREGSLYRATSDDGWQYIISGAAIAVPTEPWEGTALGAPDILAHPDGRLILVYAGGDGGGGIGALVSDDGAQSWSRLPDPILTASDSFEGTAVRSPALALWPGPPEELLLYFEGGDGAGIGIARAPSLSTAGADFEPSPTAVLTTSDVEDPVLWHDLTRIGAPSVRIEPDLTQGYRVRLWFVGLGIESEDAAFMGGVAPAVPNESVVYAESPDGVTFAPYPFNPVFDRPVAAVLHERENEPSVFALGDEYWMFFEARNQSGVDEDGIRLAIHPLR